ncbi:MULTISPECIES: helix-turn-helix domain-containing protein [Streptomyces]|uniref:helix-turn-helix domain-containing protein n=1 Tax=Streptomyces TaxID=1883 RepID=UPI000B9EA8AC|nr:helix-turn-helix transcriptional regulator [Streptomyces kasugaensis]
MPAESGNGVGKRIAYRRRVARLTQQQLADAALIHVGTLRKIERGARGVSDSVLEAIAAALGVDPAVLLEQRDRADMRVHEAMPLLSAVIAAYDMPDDGPVRPLYQLHAAIDEAETWRLGAEYVRISRKVPALLAELSRALERASAEDRGAVAGLLVRAYRTADAVAYKYGARDLSARLIDLMRWAARQAEDPLLDASVAYVRTETFFAARAHAPGLRALEHALDAAPASDDEPSLAARGALHMRAAVIAGRAGKGEEADTHLTQARDLGDRVPESVYRGTAFGPDSVRIHEVSVAVSLGDRHTQRALDVADEWRPPQTLTAERRSGFYIELARAQLWAGRPDHAFESLKVARRIAPQHAREHVWVREDAATLRRLKRADAESLTHFAEWCHATG